MCAPCCMGSRTSRVGGDAGRAVGRGVGGDGVTLVSASERAAATERSLWRSVAVPTEHGGWGLTLEPVLLGLVIAFSWSGLAIGLAAFVAFLARTPTKLAMVDRRRHRSLPRTRLATRVAALELCLLFVLAALATWSAGIAWLIPMLIAAPLVATELWFDVRSRSRRLVPELAGAIGITAVAASITVAGDEAWRLAAALWMILAARAVASIPYVRTQIVRTRRGSSPLGTTDLFQLAGAVIGFAAVAVTTEVLVGAIAVAVVAMAQAVALRRAHIPPVKVIGLRQMATGLTIVAATAFGLFA